nr:uncharacterized protein LOC124815519 [Hydra vulgaris]
MYKQVGYKDSKTGIQSFSENLFSRQKLLSEIQNYFLQDANNSSLVLYGMSGVGKTHIARKYSELSYNFYKNIVWIDAAFGMLQTSMRNQCQILGLEVRDSKRDYLNIKVIVEKVHKYYKNEKTLFIFDNVDDESVKNFSMYISRKPNSFTLITSQWRTWSSNVNKMLVDVFSSEEAFAYVKNNIKENSDGNTRNLIKELGYHPFAITQAIKYINLHKVSIEKYIDRYRLKPLEILDNNNFYTEEESKSAIKAINLVLIKLEKTKPFLFKILNCLSHCDGQNISKQFIAQISNLMETNDESLIDETIGLLMSYSLLNCFDDKKYTIHELTQLTCRCFQKRNSNTNTYLDLIENYFKFELNEIKDHMDYGNHFVFHFIYMFRSNKERFSETFHHMTTSIHKILICRGLFKEAIEILKAVQNFNTETYGENNKITLDTKHNIASCLDKMGKYNEALEIYYSVYKIKTETLGINHPSTMATKHNIALCLDEMGKYNEALEIYYSVDKIRTEILGINHPSTMTTKHSIAFCLYNMGKYNEALEIYYSVDKIQTEILGINHPSTITTKHNIALYPQNALVIDNKNERNLIDDIDSNDCKQLEKRTNLKQEQITNICTHHHDTLVVRYESNQKSLCTPFLSHQKVCRASLRVITMHTVLEAETIGVQPVEVKGLHKSGKIREGKRKLTALTTSIKKQVAISLNISGESFEEQSKFEDDDEIEFDQWTTTDMLNLTHNKEPVFEYIELVCRKLEKLAPHSYLAKSQALYLRSRKEDMNEVTALFLGDFSENYKFVVQDEVQSFHWKNLQCTLHTVIIYFQKEGILKHKIYCVISDDMIHDVNMVGTKLCSVDEKFALIHDFGNIQIITVNLVPELVRDYNRTALTLGGKYNDLSKYYRFLLPRLE